MWMFCDSWIKISLMAEIKKLVKEYLDYLEIEKNRSPKTQKNYRRYLEIFFNYARISSPVQITEESVRRFRVELARRNIKKITQSYYVIALRNFLKYLIKRDFKVLPPERIELPKVTRRQIDLIEYQDLERLLAAPRGNDFRSLRDKAILETLFSTGLRLSELCALNRIIDLKRGELTVRGKGDRLRLVFLSETAKKALKNYLDKRSDAEEALFVSLDKSGQVIGRITGRAVERLVERYARQVGITKRVYPHALRHSFATDLLINGADLRSVQELLGHSNIATTQIYTHLTNKELREIHRTFHSRRRDTS